MKKILIIEDTKTYARIIAAHIEHELGMPFDIAETQKEATEFLTQAPNEYCIAIVDLHLPDSPNGEIMDALAPFKIPSIILTSDVSESMREDILSHKYVSDYVVKKVTNAFVLVIEAIRRLLRNMNTKVLVVDDSRVARRLLCNVLEAQLLNVHAVESAEKALEVLEQEPGIRLVITDGELDGLSGIELTSRLRKDFSFNDVAVIGISGVYNSSQSIAFLKAGANDFIAKPFNNEELITRVNQNLDRIMDLARLNEYGESQKLLLQMVNQDIHQPLSNVHNLIDLATVQFANSPERLVQCLHSIQGSTRNILGMLAGVQQYAKLLVTPDLAWSTFRLNEAWFNVEADMLAMAADKSLTIEASLFSDPIHGDKSKIAQLLASLIEATIALANSGSCIQITNEYIGDDIWVSVCCDGQILDETSQQNLFKPFVPMGDQQEHVAGLGLALGQKIAELHNGSVGYEALDTGSSFWFKLRK